MRLYTFGNYYLSSIQQGIQGHHAGWRMAIKYPHNSREYKMIRDYAENHETIIALNGGDAGKLRGLVKMLEHKDNPYPWAKFNESKMSLDRTMTCVCILLPARMYDKRLDPEDIASLPDTEKAEYEFTKWEQRFLKFKDGCPLAR